MGTTVTYEPPTATDYFLKSVACTPDSENLFALGTTEVTCTTKDTSDNIATKTFKVAVSMLSLVNSLSQRWKQCIQEVTK